MIVVIGQFRFPPENVPAARTVMAKVIAATRVEAGCVAYNYAEDVLDPGLIRVSEVWHSREQLTAHLQAPHMVVWVDERTALGLSGRSIKSYEADDGTPL